VIDTPEPYLWIGIAAALAISALGVASYFFYRILAKRWIRRSTMHLIGYRERITASRKTMEAVLEHLASTNESGLLLFATHSTDENRRTLTEISSRMLITRDELDIRRLHPITHKAAEELADAAHLIAIYTLPYEGNMSPAETLDALSCIDLRAIAEQYLIADTLLVELCIAYDVDESVVYGGGLYI